MTSRWLNYWVYPLRRFGGGGFVSKDRSISSLGRWFATGRRISPRGCNRGRLAENRAVRPSDAGDFNDPFEEAPLFATGTEISFTACEEGAYYAVRVPKLRPARAGERRGPCPLHNGKDD